MSATVTNFQKLIDDVRAAKMALATQSDADRTLTEGALAFEGLAFNRASDGGFTIEPQSAPATLVDDPDRLSLTSLLDFYRKAKRRRYEKHLAGGYTGLKCVAEGDSWLELPPIGYATDLIRELWNDYAILSLAKAGDDWADVLRQDELFTTVAEERPDVVLLSIGGNNVLGSIETFAHHWTSERPKDEYLNEEFGYELNKIEFYTDRWVSNLVDMGCDVILHAYAYADPRPARDGGWLIGGPLSRERNINDRVIWRNLVTEMIDLFAARMRSLSQNPKFGGRFRFLDTRQDLGAGSDWWQAEVHPTKKGFEAVALRVRSELDAIAAARAGT